MRLRLTVKRHELPDTPVTWYIDTRSAPTVFQLLEQVNEAIPVESSGQWGLEDYAVELKGSHKTNFECLHFQEVGKVMKEDDEVIIRPLLTRDLKIRRVSGRHQISADGRHLVDGLALGRPKLRVPPGRPNISIPPRKRPRLMITEDDGDDEGLEALGSQDEVNNANRELVLHADFDDDNSEDDDDFALGEFGDPGDEDDESMDEEPEDDQWDISDREQTHFARHEAATRSAEVDGVAKDGDSDDDSLADVSDESDRSKIRKLHASFPKSSLSLCRHVFQGAGGDMAVSWEALNCGFRAAVPKNTIQEISHGSPSLSIRKTRSKSKKRHHPSDIDSIDADTDEYWDPVLSYYDQNGLPPGSIGSGKALSAMAESLKNSSDHHHAELSTSVLSKVNIERDARETLPKGFSSAPPIREYFLKDDEDSDDSTSDSSSEENEETTSTSGDSESSSESSDLSSEDESLSESSTSGSDSSSESSSDGDEPEEISSRPTEDSSVEEPSLPTLDKAEKTADAPFTVPPYHGKKATRKRNERRRQSNALNRYLKLGILPAGTTLQEFRQIKPDENMSADNPVEALDVERAAEVSLGIDKSKTKCTEFERKREELLASLASGGIQFDGPSPTVATETLTVEDQAAQADVPMRDIYESQIKSQGHTDSSIAPKMQYHTLTPEEGPRQISEDTDGALLSEAEVPQPSLLLTNASKSATPQSRRTRLDLSAGRRLLFGALGMKNPKTKKDEEKIRNDLIKDVRPLAKTKTEERQALNTYDETEDEGLEAWRNKIVYRAVECCYDGVELSEPPFPFQQRWDPQQKSSWSRTGNGRDKRKGQEYRAQSYEHTNPSKKQKRSKNKHSYAEEREYLEQLYEPSYQEESIDLHYDEPAEIEDTRDDNANAEVSQQLLNSIQALSPDFSEEPDDLVPLPDDPSSLPGLQEGNATAGMIIAFKQYVMSAETNWQPQMSPYRTALVTNISEEGLDLTLAKRDRVQSVKVYDEETGDRIYGKFDMPIDDEEEEEEDDGRLTLPFNLLIEPRVVLDSVMGMSQDVAMEEVPQQGQHANIDALEGGKSQNVETSRDDLVPLAPEHAGHDGPSTDERGGHYLVEGQFSHVTETQLDLDDAEVHQVLRTDQTSIGSDAVDAQESNTSRQIEEADGGTEQNTSKYATSNGGTESPVTPLKDETAMSIGADLSIDSVSEGNRREISHLIKEAGFRSSIPSSVIKDIRPDDMTSPGDAAVFEKLLKNMTEIEQGPSYSPKYTGLEGSPTRKHPRSKAPEEFEPDALRLSEPFTRGSSRSPLSSLQLPSQIQEPPQSSWQTIESEEDEDLESDKDGNKKEQEMSNVHLEAQKDTIKPIIAEPNGQDLVPLTIKLKDATSVTSVLKKKNVAKARRVPVSKAQAIWEQLQLQNKNLPTGLTDNPNYANIVEDGVSSTGIQYPKLSTGSSFTSQVTDHGRQPDFNFDDSADTNTDTFKVPGLDGDEGPEANVEPEPSNRGHNSHNREVNQTSGPFYAEPRVRARNTVNSQIESRTNGTEPAEATSDEDFPTLEYICSQPLPKKETLTPAKRSRAKKGEVGIDASEDSDQSTPKASHQYKRRPKTRQAIHPHASRTQSSVAQVSLPQSSQSKFAIPEGSQVMDLTVSSDAESDRAQDNEHEEAQLKQFKKYDLDGAEDQVFDDGKWVLKARKPRMRKKAALA